MKSDTLFCVSRTRVFLWLQLTIPEWFSLHFQNHSTLAFVKTFELRWTEIHVKTLDTYLYFLLVKLIQINNKTSSNFTDKSERKCQLVFVFVIQCASLVILILKDPIASSTVPKSKTNDPRWSKHLLLMEIRWKAPSSFLESILHIAWRRKSCTLFSFSRQAKEIMSQMKLSISPVLMHIFRKHRIKENIGIIRDFHSFLRRRPLLLSFNCC